MRAQFFGPLAVGNVLDNDTPTKRATFALSNGRFQPCPERRSVFLCQAQFASLWQADFREIPPQKVVDVLVVPENETGQRLSGQCTSGHAEQGSGGEVGFKDQSFFG